MIRISFSGVCIEVPFAAWLDRLRRAFYTSLSACQQSTSLLAAPGCVVLRMDIPWRCLGQFCPTEETADWLALRHGFVSLHRIILSDSPGWENTSLRLTREYRPEQDSLTYRHIGIWIQQQSEVPPTMALCGMTIAKLLLLTTKVANSPARVRWDPPLVESSVTYAIIQARKTRWKASSSGGCWKRASGTRSSK